MRYTLVIILLFSPLHRIVAQTQAALQVTHYNESNGLNNGKVTAMLQGKNGYLWFGTSNGLLSFDSYNFRQYNHPAMLNAITNLAEDSNHRIWMSFLGGGLASFDPATGKFRNYKVQHANDPALGKAEVTFLYFDHKGDLWMGITQKGLVKADFEKGIYSIFNVVSDTSNFYTPHFRKIFNTVYNIYEDGTGKFWLATHDGLYLFNPAIKQMLAVREKKLEKNRHQRLDLFGSIVTDNNSLWLGAWAGGLSSFNKITGAWNNYLPDTAMLGNPLYNLIASVCAKNDKELWIGSADKGLGVFNKISRQFYFFNSDNIHSNLPKADWAKMIIDKDKNVWAVNNEGLIKVSVPEYRFHYNAFPVKKKTGNMFSINDMWEDGKKRLVATSFADGLQVWNKKTGMRYTLPVASLAKEEKSMEVRQIMKDSKGNLWIVSRDFIYQYDEAKNKLITVKQPPFYSPESPSNSFTHIAEDREGKIWIATKRNGVFVFDVSAGKYLHYGNQERGDNFMNCSYILDIEIDGKGRVWLGSSYEFLAYIEPGSGRITEVGKKNDPLEKLSGNQTYSLLADKKGNIWAGTFKGLCYINCSGSIPIIERALTAGDGLHSNLISNLKEDNQGNIWCITDAAICRIDVKDLHISRYQTMDGLLNDVESNKIVTGPRDSLLLLGTNGYYDFDTKELHTEASHEAPLIITKMMVNDKDFYFDSLLKKDGKIKLSALQNVFSFEFAAVDFVRSGNQKYQYILEGFDKNWIDAGNRRFVSYTNLNGGNYTFKVKRLADGATVKEKIISIPLFISTPFYKTFLFYFLLVCLTATILYGLYRNRIRQHREVHDLHSKTQLLEKEKAMVMYEGLKQQLNPHFLFNSLTSLSGLIQTNQKLAGKFLEQMSKIYRYILKNRTNETVSVSEELKFVSNYIQLQQTRFNEGLQVNIKVAEEYHLRKIAPVTLQNLVENAIKHNIIDNDRPLKIEIFCGEDYIIVQNNLQKKDFVETSNKQGLLNMQSLYLYLTNRPIVVQEGAGKFIIKIPLL